MKVPFAVLATTVTNELYCRVYCEVRGSPQPYALLVRGMEATAGQLSRPIER
jgi:hypothetical protein